LATILAYLIYKLFKNPFGKDINLLVRVNDEVLKKYFTENKYFRAKITVVDLIKNND
jgi:hypothetical protein